MTVLLVKFMLEAGYPPSIVSCAAFTTLSILLQVFITYGLADPFSTNLCSSLLSHTISFIVFSHTSRFLSARTDGIFYSINSSQILGILNGRISAATICLVLLACSCPRVEPPKARCIAFHFFSSSLLACLFFATLIAISAAFKMY